MTEGRIYNWPDGTITKVLLASNGSLYFGSEEPMDSLPIVYDEETGEFIDDVLAYDSARGIVTRAMKGEDGSFFLDATGENVATITEKRRVRIVYSD